LHGNPGFGKSEAAFQISKLLGLNFDYITLVLQTSDTRLIGYKDGGTSIVSSTTPPVTLQRLTPHAFKTGNTLRKNPKTTIAPM
jgi:MoxR-like ATPase